MKFFIYFLKTWPYIWKQNIFFLYIFATFQRKPCILIPDLYFYNIKIQTIINKKNTRENHIFLKGFWIFFRILPSRQPARPQLLLFSVFFFFWGGGMPVRTGLDPAGLIWSWTQASDPVLSSKHAWIKSRVHSNERIKICMQQ